MLVRGGWPAAVAEIVVGLVVWYLLAPLFPGVIGTVVMVLGIILALFGVISLVASFTGGPRTGV